MMNRYQKIGVAAVLFLMSLGSSNVMADAVTDWNQRAGGIVVNANIGPLPAERALAIVQTSVYEAVNAITQRYPISDVKLPAASGASIEAAVAAANRAALTKLVPSQQAEIDNAYQSALTAIAEEAAAAVLALRSDDGATDGESYRPYTKAGVYVPTVLPEAPQWMARKPWLMAQPAQFRPGPPPELSSELWARDFNEVKALGSKKSQQRNAEQTEIARFWEEVMPPIYHGIVRSVANMPGREITQNARLFAAVTQASDDALIAVFDAKYHYGFWRPVTAIRNGDIDGNEATRAGSILGALYRYTDASRIPVRTLYCFRSSGHGTAGRNRRWPNTGINKTISKAAGGVARSWVKLDDFMQEVANARIYDGVHYRNSGKVGSEMGKQVAQLAAKKYLLRSK